MNWLFVTLSNLRNRHLVLIDSLIFLETPLLALQFRCLDSCPGFNSYLSQLLNATLLFLCIKLLVLNTLGFYKRYWRYASINELVDLTMMMTAATIAQSFAFYGLQSSGMTGLELLPRSLPLVDGVLALLSVGAVRFSIRATEQVERQVKLRKLGERVLIVGAGHAGIALLQTIQGDQSLEYVPVGFVDDHPQKKAIQIRGLPVLGNRSQLAELIRIHHIDLVIVAMPSASGAVIREIANTCRNLGIPVKTLPSLDEILSDKVRIQALREIKIEDLLRRAPIQTDLQRISNFLRGRKVLITGAGGSIGSELCRQILKCNPAEMILLGHGENSIFLIHQELLQVLDTLQQEGKVLHPLPQIKTCIADVRSYERLHHVFSEFHPEVVFHAAAHKHVPLMEMNAAEAVTNNILGTRNLVEIALQFEINHLVMISTDKAVNPTSIMGVSKRVAEMLVLRAAQRSGRAYVVVRFGNVLGSRGSVIPTFMKQIAAGGPITITHPDICRFFMTIPEAVQLVLQSSVLGQGGEVFTLDMGDPLKILHLAEDLIRLSGYEVGRDIQITFTGLRPGEKLYEELFISGEDYRKTKHEKILIAHNASHFVAPDLDAAIHALTQAATQNDTELILGLFQRLVAEYTPQAKPMAAKPATAPQWQLPSPLRSQLPTPPAANVVKDKTVGSQVNLELPMEGLQVHYQPVLGLRARQVVGFEALLRCEHPEKGIVLAGECLALARQRHLTDHVSQWMLNSVCAQAAVWQKRAKPGQVMPISLNLSSQEFYQPDLCDSVRRAIQSTHLNPQVLHLEIPGFVLLEDPERSADIVYQLKQLGVKVNIDNCCDRDILSRRWSTWMEHLQTPVDQLKLDRSLVQRLDSPEHRASVRCLDTLQTSANALGADLVAVGVDHPQQLQGLEAIDCHFAQGFWFSAPVSNQIASRFLEFGLEGQIHA